jgi:hypothetical protein
MRLAFNACSEIGLSCRNKEDCDCAETHAMRLYKKDEQKKGLSFPCSPSPFGLRAEAYGEGVR